VHTELGREEEDEEEEKLAENSSDKIR